MERVSDLRGKKFKDIYDNSQGGIAIEFEDGMIANFNVSTYPDGTVSDVDLDYLEMQEED